MAEPLIDHIRDSFDLNSGERARLLREPTIGSVIPDMLFGIWSGEMPKWRGLNSVSRHVLAWLAERKFASSEDQLCESLFLNKYAASSAVLRLEQVGAVGKRDSGELFLRPQFDVLGSARLIAIEMKLKRWRGALDQAISYRSFADEVYVVMDGAQVRISDSAREAFVSNGVGLILHCDSGFLSEIPACRVVPAPSVNRLFALTKLTSGPYCLA